MECSDACRDRRRRRHGVEGNGDVADGPAVTDHDDVLAEHLVEVGKV
jgi:hypothetical protein